MTRFCCWFVRLMPCLEPDNNLCSGGWRAILQSIAALPHITIAYGLKDDFIGATTFDPAKVLRELNWPVDLLHQDKPHDAILQFCREMRKGVHSGDPVASCLLLGPGGAGKSTLLHRLRTHQFLPSLESTDGLSVGMCCGFGCAVKRMGASAVVHDATCCLRRNAFYQGAWHMPCRTRKLSWCVNQRINAAVKRYTTS